MQQGSHHHQQSTTLQQHDYSSSVDWKKRCQTIMVEYAQLEQLYEEQKKLNDIITTQNEQYIHSMFCLLTDIHPLLIISCRV
jgi:hypothetical protein